MSSPSTDSKSQILQACRALFAPGQVAELRILGLGGRGGRTHNASGWFNDWELLAKTANNYDGRSKPEGIYVTLNPVHEACMARSPNGVKEYQKVTTSDREILRRHWLPIDVDPVRPSGVSSTDSELAAARKVAKAITTWLEDELGFPPGIRACSGNGIHLLYRIDLPNDDESKALVSRCLAVLDARFSTSIIKVDQTNINAARIFKLYGTTARKGEPLDDRPHRRAYLIAVKGQLQEFEQIACVPGIKLEELAAIAGDTPAPAAATKRRTSRSNGQAVNSSGQLGEYAVDLDAFVAEHNIEVTKIESFDSTGLRYYLACCLFDSSHTGTSAILGRSREGAIFYKCQHDSCNGKAWRDVCQLFEGQPKLKPIGTPAAPGKPAVKPSKSSGSSADSDDPWALAGTMLDEEFRDADTGHVMLRRYRQTFYRYSEARRKYAELSDDTIRVGVTRFLGDRVDKVTVRKVADVQNCLGAQVTVPSEFDLPFICRVDAETKCASGDPTRHNWLTLANGILDLDAVIGGDEIKKSLLPHNPDWFTLTSLPFPFPVDPDDERCDVWRAFLSQTFEGDEERIAIIQESFGSCFLPDASAYEAFFILHGPGRNGKGTVLNVLRNLLGSENYSSLSIEQLADRYLIYSLYGKLANLCGDMNEIDRVAEGLLKTIVSGERVTADRKYKDSIQFVPRARFFFATNPLPRFTDTSIGTWRRMLLVPFDFTVSEENKDIRLGQKLEKELPGILLWAIEGMVRLHKAGTFSKSAKCERALRDYRLNCLPILMFLEECTDSISGYYESIGDLWEAYRRWCTACGLSKPKPVHQFAKDVLGFLKEKVSYQREQGVPEAKMQLCGIRIKPDAAMLPGAATGGWDYETNQ